MPASRSESVSYSNANASQAILRTVDLGVSFGGHQAVNAVSTSFHGGALTAIVGPNGAGKTTYFNLISGQIAASQGEVWLSSENVTALSVSQRARKGLGRAFQLTNLFPRLSVLENIRLVAQSMQSGRHHHGFDFWRIWSDAADLIEHATDILRSVSMAAQLGDPVATLSHGDQRKLEVAMLIAMNPTVYMFDEPTAGMSADEVPVVLDLIRDLKTHSHKTILLVEHKMDVVRDLADRIVVLHNGQLVADGEPAEVINSDIVQEAYLGTRGGARRGLM
ncbi:ABC transporter ATP-binding protein [Bradyrhizobium sp. DOA9]|uniref:ABC transporter ATP-binding protein n=1 Tax=Bradyrhizobium sp. DOA9 TaxID=1126627 RepID=UPI000499884A|nr:ABC transporter ATP-binding protein [Bradyrhizobium sp. DOA9]GAJ37556.1 high-affinity branched-chain amino acid transport ATP-binding protein BivG [Bradyrhizobium sp. DOA9]